MSVSTPSVAVPGISVAAPKAQGQLKPMSSAQIQKQATSAVSAAYQPTISDLQSQISGAEGLAAKRTSDNEYYQTWLSSQTGALQAQQAAQSQTITNALTAISQSASNLGANGSAAMAAQANQRAGNTAAISGNDLVSSMGNTGQSEVDTAAALGVANRGISDGLINAGGLNDEATIQNAESTNQATLQKSLQAIDTTLAQTGTNEGNAITSQENTLTSNAQQIAESNQSNRIAYGENQQAYKTDLAESNRSAAMTATQDSIANQQKNRQIHNQANQFGKTLGERASEFSQNIGLDTAKVAESTREFNKDYNLSAATLGNTTADDAQTRKDEAAAVADTDAKTAGYLSTVANENKNRSLQTVLDSKKDAAAIAEEKSLIQSRGDADTDTGLKTAAYIKSLNQDQRDKAAQLYGEYGINIMGKAIGTDKKTGNALLSQTGQNEWHAKLNATSSALQSDITNGYTSINGKTTPLASLSYNQLRQLYTTGGTIYTRDVSTGTENGKASQDNKLVSKTVSPIAADDPVGWTAFNMATGHGLTAWDKSALRVYGINTKGVTGSSKPVTTKPAKTTKKKK